MTDDDLSHLPRLNIADPVECAQIVMNTKSAHVVNPDGKGEMLLDYFTASAIVGVYNALTSEEARTKLRGMGLMHAALACLKLVER